MNGQLPDVTVMLDCILDSSFLKLELTIPFPSFQSFCSLLSVISDRCPHLEKLAIHFKHIGTDKSKAMSPITKPVVLPLTPLPCLTSLSLLDGRKALHNKPDYGFIFSIVGKCFPLLSTFRFKEFHLRKLDVIKLIVKEELVDIIFTRPSQDDEGWSADSVLASLRIPTEYLNPICFTLETMYTDPAMCCLCTTSGRCLSEDWSIAPFAFALRHLTRLHTVDLEHAGDNDWTAETIKIIYKAPTDHTTQRDFEKDCREAALRVGLTIASSTLLPNGSTFI